MVNINILGSCVTRDAIQKTNKYNLSNYFARTSIISIMSQTYPIKFEDILLNSNFQRKSVYQDASKETLQKLMNQPSEYLIIDLIDERFKLIQMRESILTLSNELRGSSILNNLTYKELERDNKEVLELWYKSADAFFRKVLNVYNPSKVILHKTFWREKYLNQAKQQNDFSDVVMKEIQKQNRLLKYYYDYCESIVPSISVVDMTDDSFLSCENHTWGLAPYHFEKAYYDVFLKKLDNIIFNKQNSEKLIGSGFEKSHTKNRRVFEELKETFKTSTKCSLSDESVDVSIEYNEDNNLRFAFYIKNNQDIIYKGWYNETPAFSYSLKDIDIGIIEVVVFVRNQDGNQFHYSIEINS